MQVSDVLLIAVPAVILVLVSIMWRRRRSKAAKMVVQYGETMNHLYGHRGESP